MLSDFEVGEEFGWGEESVVYAAKKNGEPGRDLALKIRQVTDAAQGNELLDAAQDQEKASQSGCRSIVNIVSAGTGVGEMYHVTPRYPRSLLTLIQGKVAVHPEGLLHLCGSALAALRDLLTRMGRAHGNLKPSNVLLAGTSQLRESDIFLTDLAPARQAQTTDDLAALGRIVFSLVRKREVERYDYPLHLTAEWKNLGPRAGDWLKFTNVLLDPSLGRKGDALAVAEKAFAQLQKGHGGLSGLMPMIKLGAIAAGVLALIGGVGFTAWQIAHRPKTETVTQDSTESPDEWFGNLALELIAKPKWTSADPYINDKIVKPIRALDLRDKDARLLQQAELPPDANARVKSAAELLPQIRQNLDAWDARVALQRSFNNFKRLGWAFPARSLESLAGSISNDRPVLEQIQDTLTSGKLAADIDAKWQQLQKLGDSLDDTGDPVLRGAVPWAATEAGKGQNLYDLQARLDATLKRLQTDLQLLKTADRARFQREANLPEVRNTVTSPVIEEWERQVKRFQPAPSEAARLSRAWKGRFDSIAAKASRAKGPDAAAWQTNFRQAQQDADDTLKGLIAGEVEDVATKMNATLDNLERQIPADGGGVVAMAPTNPTPVVPEPAAPSRPATPAPGGMDREAQDRQAWTQILAAARNVDLGAATSDQAKAVRDTLVSAVYRQTSPAFQSRLNSYLASLNAIAFPAEPAGPAGAPKLPGWEGPVPAPGGVAYRFGNYTMEFLQIPADGERQPFYLSRFETPVGLVVDWVNARGGASGWTALGIRTNATVAGPRAWVAQGAGIGVRNDFNNPWAWPTSLTNQLPFYAAPPNPPPGPLMPLNYVSANSAAAIAGVMGARLPSTEEWQRPARLQLRNLDSPLRNLRDGAWEDQRKYVAKSVNDLKARGTELPDPPWPDGDIFLPSSVSVPRRDRATPAVETNDKTLWFSPVTQGEPGKLLNMVGNVAEFVADADGSGPPRFSVIGGSALSPREIDPSTPYVLNPAQRLAQYSDVGFRLALSLSGGGGGSRKEVAALQQLLANPPVPAN